MGRGHPRAGEGEAYLGAQTVATLGVGLEQQQSTWRHIMVDLFAP